MVLINIGSWKEVWEGTVSSSEISGNLISGSSKYTFKITEPVAAPVVKSAPLAAGEYQGVHRHWTDKVIINADGTHKRASNGDPGTWTFDGTTLVLKWKNWAAETLVQTAPGQFSCKEYKFTLTGPGAAVVATSGVSTEPFVNGAILKWSTSANQNGTMTVTSVTGTKFTVNQVNFNNKAAGTIKFEGEVKDGKITLSSTRGREVWTGTYSNGTVKGKIDNWYTFTITK
jgi:hypothetical protein